MSYNPYQQQQDQGYYYGDQVVQDEQYYDDQQQGYGHQQGYGQEYGQEYEYYQSQGGQQDEYGVQQQQQQQQQMQLDQQYYVDPSAYIDQHQQVYGGGEEAYMYQDATAAAAASSAAAAAAMNVEPGSYYLDGEILPQIYDHAVSALAYDKSYNCLYISSTTLNNSNSGLSGTYHQRRRGGAGGSAKAASLFMTYSTRRNDIVNDGMFLDGGTMYSSVSGHPEASSSTLKSIYKAIYGISNVVPPSPSAAMLSMSAGGRGRGAGAGGTRQGQPPSHSYRPPYGNGTSHTNLALAAFPHQQQHQQQQYQQKGHMGINDLLPLEGTDGYVASVSPSSVRVHSSGGIQESHNDMEGMVCGTIHPYSMGMAAATHITVGGLHVDTQSSVSPSSNNATSSRRGGQSIHCMDLWQGLRTVQSLSFKALDARSVAVTALATSHDKGSMVAGCSDGMIRLVSSSLQEMATIKSNLGGVSNVAISPDGMLIATTGFSSKAKPVVGPDGSCSAAALYAFPDTTIYVYDIRYLGRGGIAHPFTGVKGSPRHLAFIPNMDGYASNRILVSSGKSGGGVQIMTPFELQSESTTSFFLPPLETDEFVTALSAPEEDGLAFGTSMGRVMTYRLQGYENTKPKIDMTGQQVEKADLLVPPYVPALPSLSLPPNLLQSDPSLPRNGSNDQQRNIFSTYLLCSDPVLTPIGETPDDAIPTFGSIAVTPIVEDTKRTVKKSALSKAVVGEKDYILTLPISAAGIDVDIFANHNKVSKNYKGKKTQRTLANPNKFLYCPKLSSLVYEETWYMKRNEQQNLRGSQDSNQGIPSRYQQNTRPTFRSSASFDAPDMNDSGLYPGWDYPSSLPNSWACPVLLLLYFIPEVRQAALSVQFVSNAQFQKAYDRALTPELGFIFHQIDCLSRGGLLYPSKSPKSKFRARIGTWQPTNFLSFFATMSEAEQLQVLDSSPSAVDHARRPESFYRFLAYQIDKELEMLTGIPDGSTTKLMDSLNGLDFVSSNQFIESSSSPTHSTTRALTLDLNYDIFPAGTEKTPIGFGKLLQHSLCRETRLRAWNSASKCYETIVQRKIVTSLPELLTLSCSCAGRKSDDGLWAWRSMVDEEPWLPEFVEIELKEAGDVLVREWRNGLQDIFVYESKSTLPPEVSKLVSSSSTPQKKLYRLEAVISYISSPNQTPVDDVRSSGHHVLHARVSNMQKKQTLERQKQEAIKCASLQESDEDDEDLMKFVQSAAVDKKQLEGRAAQIEQQANACVVPDDEPIGYPPAAESEWILYNGSNVSKTIIDDARAFHVAFKEPVLVTFQAIDKAGNPDRSDNTKADDYTKLEVPSVPTNLKNPWILTSSVNNIPRNSLENLCPGNPVAFDAEFVAVQEEESTLNGAGQKEVTRETRLTVGRISVLECEKKSPIIDDHVLPRETVVDYLTRFSGITPDDLNPRRTKHRLVSTRNAYLELRYVLEQGCIFVGHGLKQDFSTLNLVVPPYQIVDTVELYHIPGMRYISLRFLTNFVLHRDMQQDVHDSVEDARAAYELFEKAREWKKEGIWDKKLREIYAYGDKNGWKLGVDDADHLSKST